MQLTTAIRKIQAVKTKEAKEVANVFKLNKKRFEGVLAEREHGCLADIINTVLSKCYCELPNNEQISLMIVSLRDKQNDVAREINDNYFSVCQNLRCLERTDITDDERLRYFLGLHYAYNNCMKLFANILEELRKAPIERPYDIQ